jgi:hypothetical protein
MESDKRFFEQLRYFWKNRFTRSHTEVLAYCKTCLEEDKQVPLESRLIMVKRETRMIGEKYREWPEAREHYKHTINCREGHEFYNADYWTKWKQPLPPPSMPG